MDDDVFSPYWSKKISKLIKSKHLKGIVMKRIQSGPRRGISNEDLCTFLPQTGLQQWVLAGTPIDFMLLIVLQASLNDFNRHMKIDPTQLPSVERSLLAQSVA